VPFDILEAHFLFEFQDLIPKIGHGETIVEIKKFAFFGKMGIFQIKSQRSVLNVSKF